LDAPELNGIDALYVVPNDHLDRKPHAHHKERINTVLAKTRPRLRCPFPRRQSTQPERFLVRTCVGVQGRLRKHSTTDLVKNPSPFGEIRLRARSGCGNIRRRLVELGLGAAK
jgi:hypothetical protein